MRYGTGISKTAFAVLLYLAAGLAPPAFAAPAADEAADSRAPFVERFDVDVINVEAFATRDGQPAEDLTAEDFEVFEDGLGVEITNFFKNERLAETPSGNLPAADPAAAAAGPARAELPDERRQSLVVYLDLQSLRPANRTRVLRQLGGFLAERLAQGDRVMTMTYLQNLQQIHPFTEDPAEVQAGLDAAGELVTGGQMLDAERRRIEQELLRAEAADLDNAMASIKSFVQQQRLETEQGMAALETVIRSLGGLPGRRALLYVSDGLEQTPASDLFEIYREIQSRATLAGGGAGAVHPGHELKRNDLGPLFARVAQSANSHQVTLYTLQARGSAGISPVSAAESGASAGIAGRSGAVVQRTQAEQEPLLSMADQTGGSAIVNTSNFAGALASLSRDFDSLYSLGYRSRGGGDGKYHRIEVKVKRPGYKVRHRSGYLASKPEEKVAGRAFSSLIFDRESNSLGVEVDFATPQPAGLGKYHLPLLVRIPTSQLILVPDGDKMTGRLRLFFAVKDPGGAISQVQEIPYNVEIALADFEAAATRGIGFALKLAVREGRPKIAVGVWDELSGTESYLVKSIPVGAGPQKTKN